MVRLHLANYFLMTSIIFNNFKHWRTVCNIFEYAIGGAIGTTTLVNDNNLCEAHLQIYYYYSFPVHSIIPSTNFKLVPITLGVKASCREGSGNATDNMND